MKPVSMTRRFSFRVIAGLIFMLFLVGIPFFYLFLNHHRNQLMEAMRNSTTNLSRMLTRQVEIAMLEGRHEELQRTVETLAAGSDTLRVMVLDAKGRVAISSDTEQRGRIFEMSTDPGCRECHAAGTTQHTISLSDARGFSFYRNVNVIRNRPSCHSCHDPSSEVNGVLVMDISQATLESQFSSSVIRILWMGGTMLLLTIAVLYFLLNQLAIQKLRRFAEATEELGSGSFPQISLPGGDEFGRLADSFNLMSDSLGSAMKETQASKEYLESVINNIDDEIVVVDRKFGVVTANAAFYQNRQSEKRLIPEDDCAQWEEDGKCEGKPVVCGTCASARTFQDGRVHKVLQSYVDREGKERFLEAYSSPLRDAQGEIRHVIEVRRDITERKLLEANVAHSERLVYLGMLASGLAHEINNPLGSISTFVDGLKRRLIDREDDSEDRLERSLGLIQREIERAKDVTHRLLILAQKNDSGRSLVDLNHSLLETVSLVQYEAGRRGIRIDVDVGEGMPVLKASESQIRQVFLNLLLNSLEAGHAGGFVRCRTWHENGRALASVEDDGRGIEAGDLLKIFDPFFSKKNHGHRTGLGLFICKSLISSMGGSVHVVSRVGIGSRFTVELPIRS